MGGAADEPEGDQAAIKTQPLPPTGSQPGTEADAGGWTRGRRFLNPAQAPDSWTLGQNSIYVLI